MSSLPIDRQSHGASLRLHDQVPLGADSAPNIGAPSGSENPFSEIHLHQIELGSKRAKPIEKAVRYAHLSGWMTLLAGALSLPFAFNKPPMLIFALVIAGIGTRELTLHRSLKVLDCKAPKKLAINQVLLGGALIVYAVYMLASTPAQGMVESAMMADPMMQSTPELNGMMNDLVALEQVATALIYVGMIGLAVIVQGSTALYYLLKGSKLKKLHRDTPGWVVRVYQTVHS
jgi:hypothetical protein